ncbi:MAG: hypothetical protein H6591_11550 [Flavobacteriales bacterium]|nr:hypothetical protein [Flavobacteriales bacterium]
MRSYLPLLLLLACSAPDRTGTLIIGHGGGGTSSAHPLDSEASAVEALSHGADGIELDAQLTADGVLVAYHDAELRGAAPCPGKVNDLRWEELERCAAGPAPIVRLEELLPRLASEYPGVDFTLDCKLFAEGEWWPYMELFSDALAALHARPELRGRVLVECQITDFLRLVQRKAPGIRVSYYATRFSGAVDTVKANGFAGLTIDHALLSAAEVAEARAQGISVTLFGVDGAMSHRAALAKHPDRLQTDAPVDFAR